MHRVYPVARKHISLAQRGKTATSIPSAFLHEPTSGHSQKKRGKPLHAAPPDNVFPTFYRAIKTNHEGNQNSYPLKAALEPRLQPLVWKHGRQARFAILAANESHLAFN